MIHIIHTPAAVRLHQRKMLALRAFGLVLPPWVGILLWAWFTPLLQTSGSTDGQFTGVAFIPAEEAPAASPSLRPPFQAPCKVAEPEVGNIPLRSDLANLNPHQLPELPEGENDEYLLETNAEALLVVQQQEQQMPATRPRQSTSADNAPASDSYTPPTYASCPQPPYPPKLRQRRVQGSIILTINISADGSPTTGIITQSSGSPALDRHALNWVLRHWSFTPARRGSSAIASRIRTTLHFTL